MFSCGGMRAQQSWQRGKPVSDDNQRNFDAIVARALAIGINHFETARGYGTSEAQFGHALARHPRDAFVLQTKARPTEDPAQFEANLEESFALLRRADAGPVLVPRAQHAGVRGPDLARRRLLGGRRAVPARGAHPAHRLLHARADAADRRSDPLGPLRLRQPALLLHPPGQLPRAARRRRARHGRVHHQPHGQGRPPARGAAEAARAVRAAVAAGVQRRLVPGASPTSTRCRSAPRARPISTSTCRRCRCWTPRRRCCRRSSRAWRPRTATRSATTSRAAGAPGCANGPSCRAR